MPTQLNGQFDLSAATETVALASDTDIASFTSDNPTDTASAFTASIDWGDGVIDTGATIVAAGGGFTVEGSHSYTDEGVFPASVTIVRTADNSQLVIQSSGVPVADADNITGHSPATTITGNPNQALTNVVVATFSDSNTQNSAADFTVTIDWGDGTTSPGTLSGSAGSFTATGSHTYTSAGQFTITTFMNEDAPTENGPGIATTVAGIGFGGTETLQSATEFSPVPAGTQVATFADNKPGAQASDYTASIDWGDGVVTSGTVSGSAGSFVVKSASDHAYTDEGNYTLTAHITRIADSATADAAGTVAVDEGDFITGAGTTIHSPTLTLNNVTVATFSDSATANVVSDFVATIDWGDGTSSLGTISGSNGNFSVSGSHTYAQGGQDTINVTMKEDSPGVAGDNAQTTAFVGLGGQGQDINTPEGSIFNGPTATFTDGNTSDQPSDFTAQIDWGDGATTLGAISGSNGNFTVSGIHAYADEGNLTAITTVTRTADQQQLTMTSSARSIEADILQVTGNNFSGNPGQPFTNVPVASFSTTYIGNVSSDFTATINWGDGTSSAGTIVGTTGNFLVFGSHTYTTGGIDNVTVTVNDDPPGLAFATGFGTAIINLSGQMNLTSATEHNAVPNNTTVATFNDSTPGDIASDFTATIDWGDGTTSTGTVVGPGPSFSVQGGHTYADEGNDQASVTLTRISDQAKSTVSGTVAVAEGDTLTPVANTFTAIAGTAFSGTVASFGIVSGAVASDFIATIDWGDGATTAGTVSGGSSSITVSGSHTYTTNGQKTVSVTAFDDSPGTATGTAHSTANVDARPVAQNGSASGNEDTPISGQAVATDADNTQAQLNYTLVGTNGGAQHGTVSMNQHGAFTYTPAADYNGPDSFQFMANDGIALSNTATESITVNPVDDAPVIVSDGGGDTATVSAVERTTAVTTVVATDIDSPTVTYAISGGSDAAKFAIDSASGALSFITAPNFDVAADSDHNNSYIVQVSASDGTLADNQTITVNVTDDPNVTSTLHWMQSVDAGAHPPGWQPVGIGDFNADGTSDLAWFNAATGDIDIWKLANGAWSASSAVGSHPAGYQPVGDGDYNGDGTSDVLWFNPTTHDVDLWKISNGQWAGSVDIGTHPAGYQPALSADFNGDGTSDIAWYNPTTNDIDIWKISNGQWAGSVDVGTHPAGYQPVLAGDFDGDGTSDIAWYNPTTHDVDIWLIKNGQWAGSVDVGTHPAGWQPLAAADFSQDGTSDIAWYNPATNDIDVWLLKNAHWSASFDIGQHPGAAPGTAPLPGGASGAPLPGENSPPAAPQSVIAVGAGDFDHSGVNDIMWRDTGTQHIDNWLLAYS